MAQDSDRIEGQPVAALAELEQEVSPGFLQGVRKKIYRRTATNQMAAFSWNLPKVILLEFMQLIVSFVASARGGKPNR